MDPERQRLIEAFLAFLEGRPEYHTIKAAVGDHPRPEPVNGQLPDITAFRRHQFVIFRAFTAEELTGPEFEAPSRAFARCASFEHIRYHAIVPPEVEGEPGRLVALRRAAEIGVRIDNVWEV
ncbi:MAG: hypothetical protein D6739_07115 [Nitrospirae bacterium]|nr:MAG: hypothetical protein D6739_07115 [Nitrospirota bacterium]